MYEQLGVCHSEFARRANSSAVDPAPLAELRGFTESHALFSVQASPPQWLGAAYPTGGVPRPLSVWTRPFAATQQFSLQCGCILQLRPRPVPRERRGPWRAAAGALTNLMTKIDRRLSRNQAASTLATLFDTGDVPAHDTALIQLVLEHDEAILM